MYYHTSRIWNIKYVISQYKALKKVTVTTLKSNTSIKIIIKTIPPLQARV